VLFYLCKLDTFKYICQISINHSNPIFMKNQRLRLLLFVNIIFVGAVSAQNSLSWYKSFVGTLDKYPIVLHLHKMSDEYSGYYYYESRHEPIAVSGTGSGAVVSLLAEVRGTGTEEKFELSLQASTLTGKWTNNAKTFTVNLKNIDNQVLKFDYVFTKGEAKLFPKLEETPTGNYSQAAIWPKGSVAFVADLKKWIRKQYGDEKSNDDIGKIFLRQKNVFFSEFAKQKLTLKEVKDAAVSYSRADDSRMTIVYQTDKLLSLADFRYAFEGGAHGNYTTSYTTFDINNAKPLTVNDVLMPEGIKQLPKILEKYLRKTFKIAPNTPLTEILFENEIKPNQNFYVTQKGICFAYVPYEIAAYAAGQIELFIPFSEFPTTLQPAFKGLL
jgi:Protein of unknown function (DUF3298)/Deacetylase PdaC